MLKEMISSMLAELASGHIQYFGPPESPATRANRKIEAQAFYMPQFHPHTEMIFAFSGKLRIHTNGRWENFQPGMIRVFLPGAVHSECYLTKKQSYQMLWTTITAQSVTFHTTAYDFARGYYLPSPRVALQLSCAPILAASAAQARPLKNDIERFRYQAQLMDCLCQAIQGMDNISTIKVPYHQEIVEQIRHHIDHNFAKDLSLTQLGEIVHYSPCHLNVLFRKQIGIPIRQYILKKRLEQAEHLLLTTHMEIKQIAYSVGFQDPLYFSRLFHKTFGQSPAQFRP
jgi:AraC-like DNA-binding protein